MAFGISDEFLGLAAHRGGSLARLREALYISGAQRTVPAIPVAPAPFV
jgi:hypothetical protein